MRLLPLVAAATMTLGLATAVPLAPGEAHPARSERAISRVALVGGGYGHGHGLSQYGAEGAARRGLSYRQIVHFYYPGTAWGRASGPVRVLLTGDTTSDVVVVARPGLVVRPVGGGRSIRIARARPQATRWRIMPMTGRRSRVDVRTPQAPGWKRYAVLRGDAEFRAGGAPITLVTPSGTTAYRGSLRSATPAGGRGRDTVNVVALDDYLRGVVPQEVPALWHRAAVQAQAVAARTYAAYERRQPLASHYQICDTDQCQVYGGASAEHPASDAAIRATRGRIVTFGGRPAFAQFSSSNGGFTAAGGFGYLPARRDPYDGWSGNPNRTWTESLRDEVVERVFPEVGDLRSVALGDRDGHGRFGGRVGTVTVVGSRGRVTVSGDTFRSYFGLRSTLFRLR